MTSFILAQQTMQEKIAILQKMGSQIESGESNLLWKISLVILLFVSAGALLWFLYTLQRRCQGMSRSPQPLRLYLRTMRELGLPGPDLWYLYRLAKRLNLPHPTALLISTQYFDQILARDCCDKTGKVLNRSRHQRLMAIRAIVFGQDAAVS